PAAPAEETEASLDDLGLDDLMGENPPEEPAAPAEETEASLDDFGLDDLTAEETPPEEAAAPAEETGMSVTPEEPASIEEPPPFDMLPPSLDDLRPDIASKEKTRAYDLNADLSQLSQEQATEDDISDEDMALLRSILKAYPAGIRKAISNSILEDKLNKKDTKELLDKILGGDSADSVKQYLEVKLSGEIKEEGEDKSKVILTRANYTEVGIKRQAQLIKFIKYGLTAAIALLLVGGSLFNFLIQPTRYKSIVGEGKEIILSMAPEPKAMQKAEELFNKATEIYPSKPYAYLQYADAYRRKGMYENTFEKLFGKVKIKNLPLNYENTKISNSKQFWSIIKKVPSVRYASGDKSTVLINNIPWNLEKEGAYLIKHLKKGEEDANLLLALGNFHSNPAKRFHESPYRNNLLGIDYFRRVMTFDVETPAFSGNSHISSAVLGIGNVYYNQKDYYRSLEYFDKVVKNDVQNIGGHTGVLKSLIQIYRADDNPKPVIQHHNIIKHKLALEEKLPLFMMSRLAEFYIDLPTDDKLRIQYNINPTDHRTGQALKARAKELLDLIFNTTEEDLYGNQYDGKSFAEGYYQRGRYFRLVTRQMRMAMKQMEYAYKYDPRHFMALNDRAEMLLEINDYNGAIEHLKMALNQLTPENAKMLGDRSEDETLLYSDKAQIPFNMGRAMYLSTVRNLKNTDSWMRIKEVDKYQTQTDYGIDAISGIMDKIDSYWDKTREIGLKNKDSQAELSYYHGWSHYIRGNYRKALLEWESMEPSLQHKYKNLELGKSHALYHLGVNDAKNRQKYLNAALGYLSFLHNEYSNSALGVQNVAAGNAEHIKLFSRLSVIENNLGAIYEIMNNEKKALAHYWNAIEHSKKIARENEISHINLRLSFKRENLEKKEAYPLIMDFVPPTLAEESL
ncbi:MAG: hypothetical protein OEZ13_03045, partial [Spirochaetia bacterium]|nr:hypothetical protein [Spirochaetia bacterium]